MRGRLAVVALAGASAFGCSLPEAGTAAPDGSATVDVNAPAIDASHEEDAIPEAGPPDVTADNEASSPGAQYALDFSGGAYVQIGTLPIPSDFTIEAWVNPTSTSGETYIVAEDRDAQGMGQFRFGVTSGNLFFMMTDASGSSHGLYNNGYSLITTQTIPVNTWSHVAVSKSGAAFELVVDGVSAAMFDSSAPTIAYGGPAVAFRIAARVAQDGTGANGTFDGTLDEVRFWNESRSASEIAATMSMEIPAMTPNLLAYWRFDEGSGSTTADQEGTYEGTLVGSPAWVVSTAF
jgi:Concanavalin A-like lectin/glucanases superfamily